ncbi:Peptidase family C25 protein, partial [Candidatus Methanophagaceae archaeon]
MKKTMVILMAMIILLSVTASALPLVVGFCIATDDPEDLLLPTPSPVTSQNREETPSESDAGSIKVTLNAGSYEITKDAAGFEVIQMDGFSLGFLPGDPMLPHRSYDILVPPDVIGSSLQLKLISAENRSLDGTYNIKPAPPILPGTRGTEILNSRNDSINEVYETAAYFPECPVELLPYSQMRKWKFVRVDFVPFQYNPVTKALILTERAEIEISYTQSSSEIVKSLMSDTVMDDLAPQLFLNYDAAMGWYSPRIPILPQQTYDYVIFTTNAIEANSAKLAAFVTHKQKRGHSVLIVTETDFGSLTGQAPNHKAEKIRQWLKNNYAAKGIEYVLLIGDPHPYENGEGDIPMKMCHPERNQVEYDDCEQTPTDYFYADLTGNWDIDGDQYYGEWVDDYPVTGGVDFGPEVYVGRIPVYGADYTTLDNILQKIIDYESEYAISWRNSILMPMGFQHPGYDGAMLAEQMKDDYLDSNSYSSWRMYQQGNGACGLDSIYTSEEELRGGTVVRARWAADDYGIVCWWGHGSSTTTWVGYNYCWDGYLLDSSYCSSLDDDHPSFTYQCSCTNGYPENSNNLQYAVLKQGGIGTVSATRVSWFSTGVEYGYFDGSLTNSGIGYEYVDRLVQGIPGGKALYLTKQSMTPDHQCWLMNWYDFNLYGDPETSLESQGMPPNIEVNKTVRDLKTGDGEKAILANVSDELRFKIWVHNNGTGNLTNITVNDTLSAGLEYVTGSATPFGPNAIVPNPDGSTTLYWYLSSMLEYCQSITIEFNATKISGEKVRNCVNVSAWCNESDPHVQVFDTDYAVVRGQRDDTAIFRSGTWYVDTTGDHQ